jgi:hypothetical protein
MLQKIHSALSASTGAVSGTGEVTPDHDSRRPLVGWNSQRQQLIRSFAAFKQTK